MTDHQNQREIPIATPRFCDQCGLSLIPLNAIHVSRPCEVCYKTIYVAEPGEQNTGLKVRKGDSVHIPAGFIKISLDPSMGGYLFRPGIAFLVQSLLYDGSSQEPREIIKLFEVYEAKLEPLLKDSSLLKDLDLESQKGGDEA